MKCFPILLEHVRFGCSWGFVSFWVVLFMSFWAFNIHIESCQKHLLFHCFGGSLFCASIEMQCTFEAEVQGSLTRPSKPSKRKSCATGQERKDKKKKAEDKKQKRKRSWNWVLLLFVFFGSCTANLWSGCEAVQWWKLEAFRTLSSRLLEGWCSWWMFTWYHTTYSYSLWNLTGCFIYFVRVRPRNLLLRKQGSKKLFVWEKQESWKQPCKLQMEESILRKS